MEREKKKNLYQLCVRRSDWEDFESASIVYSDRSVAYGYAYYVFASRSVKHNNKMPIVTVETNLNYSDLPEDFGPSLSKFVAETLDKPEEVS